jgi:hypothetical protein
MIFQCVVDLRSSPVFSPFVSPDFMAEQFSRLVAERGTVNRPDLTVDRIMAHDVRTGLSDNLSQTLIRQLISVYDPNCFRCNAMREPWSVTFVHERGIDVGGLARELASELALDLCEPRCGLVVQTPNARNGVGDFADCVLPFPDPRHSDLERQYKFAGGFLGICIRSQLVQDFNFPPLVWEFLVTNEVTIDRIFEVDQNYKSLVTSLQEAVASGMEDEEFASKFSLRFTVYDLRGEEVPLTQRGKTEEVNISNCGAFVAMAKEFRLAEMTQCLEWMRVGFWENLGLEPLPGLSWQTIEFCACGDKAIDVNVLMGVTQVDIAREQAELFWRVVEAFNAQERSALLKFATGTPRLPPRALEQGAVCLSLDRGRDTDVLPTASTCFYAMHLPTYSSYAKAYQCIRTAVLNTGTFEFL